MAYQTIIVETKGRVGIVRLNRPNALNALNAQLIEELSVALDGLEADDGIGCIVITGSEKAFAAGADIKEMQAKTYASAFKEDFITRWYRVANMRKPSVAAVAGYPNVSVPAGLIAGLPIGISFMGRAWSEATLIKIAYAYEQATKHRKPPKLAPSLSL